ncbi:hypothetical protein CERSUDRAFT_144860 [Gelatoporia subvermispora B]|uniref:Protein kinase domain-containing protein n=1 Tax=Ceriporiopsis subvermispora (strain B) TaxID=914234 RepID=M2QHK3_CERS8|nr:hypothetical protein CERSUDRAFT_144860 [Gelatoporia subvermispora B]
MVVRQVQMSDTDVESTVKIALRRERQVLEGLDHVNIIQCLGYEETGKVCNLFLEYVAGGSLHDWLRKYGRLNEDIVQSFSEHILSGLEYLHSAGIIHSNLNSSHVLVDASGCCKITNFMDCRRHTEMRTTSRSTILSGCIFWMAPEAVAAQAECSSQIEVWSFGCTVLEMWTGKRPWHGQDATTVRLWLSRTKAPPVDGIVLSPLADDFRQRCFAKSPAQRLTASELRQHPYLELPSAYLFSGLA